MSAEEIPPIVERLRELGERLADPELSDEEAEELAREAAELAGEGSAAVERATRELGDRGSAESDL